MMLRRQRTDGPDTAENDRTLAVVLSAFVFLVFIAADVPAAECSPSTHSPSAVMPPQKAPSPF